MEAIVDICSVGDLLSRFKADLDAASASWFRGQSKAKWELLPSLARQRGDHETESDLLARFKQNATLLLSPVPGTEWEWLTVMQHHGVMTRLLDWTESPLTGMYFATNGNADSDGALWVLNPTKLNIASGIMPDYGRYRTRSLSD